MIPNGPSFTYVFDVVLTASQILPGTGKGTDTDSEFYLLGLDMTFTSVLFTLQFRYAGGNYFSSNPLQAASYQGLGPMPYTFAGEPRMFPPGSVISVDLVEGSGLSNTIQLGFIGIKVMRASKAVCQPEKMFAY